MGMIGTGGAGVAGAFGLVGTDEFGGGLTSGLVRAGGCGSANGQAMLAAVKYQVPMIVPVEVG